MSDRTSTSKQKPTYAPGGRPSRSVARANRAQVRAMHARAAASRAGQFSETEEGLAARAAQPPAAVGGRNRPAVRQIFLTRQQEYAFIRSDIRRLIITAGALFVLMIVLLFILD